MSIRTHFVLSFVVCFLASTVAAQNWTVRCHWGATAPAVHGTSVNVISTPVVLKLRSAGSSAQIAFISYDTSTHLANDANGVLRVVDSQCNEIARFPDPACLLTSSVPNAPAGFGTNPDLAPVSGVAAGDLNRDSVPEIVAVIGDGMNPHRQLAAFNLSGGCLVPQWVSPDTLPTNDNIAVSAPSIAQLDRPGGPGLTVPWDHAEVIIDNKIFASDGTRRLTGFNFPAYCGNVSCPRSRTAIVATLPAHVLPRLIMGRGIYRSQLGTTWRMFFGPAVNVIPTMNNAGLTYPAVAELDPTSVGPEIVVVDTLQGPGGAQVGTLTVLRANGATLATRSISTTDRCGGPPMIGDADGVPGPEIGVASCDSYTLYKYANNQLNVVWAESIDDPSGQTASTLYNGPNGARIVYADQTNLYILDGATGTKLQTITNGSATAFEGPVVASFNTSHPTGQCAFSRGSIIAVANDDAGGTIQGVRIFDNTTDIGNVGSCWNQHAFHITNVMTSFGFIPQSEAPSWVATSRARNTYRVQEWQ